jgi:hypothetical protein
VRVEQRKHFNLGIRGLFFKPRLMISPVERRILTTPGANTKVISPFKKLRQIPFLNPS